VVLMEAMAQERLVLAPAITGIPNWLTTSARDFFTSRARCPILSAPSVDSRQPILLGGNPAAAAASIAASYNRQRNLRAFAQEFMNGFNLGR